MKPRNTGQNKRLYGLINALGIDEETKREMVANFTNNRTDRTSGMDYYEAQNIIDHMQAVKDGKPQKPKHNNPDDPANKQRRKILSICHELGWEDGRGKIDWVRLNAYLLKYGYKHYEQLNDYSLAELPTLVTQFENLLKTHHASKRSKH